MTKWQSDEMAFLNSKNNWLLVSCWCPVIIFFAFFELAKLCSDTKPLKIALPLQYSHFLFVTSHSHMIFLVPRVGDLLRFWNPNPA